MDQWKNEWLSMENLGYRRPATAASEANFQVVVVLKNGTLTHSCLSAMLFAC